jgi:hypothetical protein
VKVTRFDPADSLIIDDIGYGPRDGDRVTSITSAIGEEPAI